jgi:FkbM family methyltransferase
MTLDDTINRSGFIACIARYPIVHKIIAKSGVYYLANRILKAVPIHRRLFKSPVIIRINSVAGLSLAEEFIDNKGYSSAIKDYRVETFIDLGCNVGWFPCLLSAIQNPLKPIGLMVDGDPEMIESSRWHLTRNELSECEVIHGAVGCSNGEKEVVFHLNPSNTQSSLKAFGANHPFPIKGVAREVRVPSINVSQEWKRRHGSRVVDLLKVDIEGAELDFLKLEKDFIMSHVRRIVCEWHEWHVIFSEVHDFLSLANFNLTVVLEKDEKGGVAVFDNAQPV